MAQFTHLTDARDVPSIRRNGIRRQRHFKLEFKAVFALPIVEDYAVSHQWLRELRRFRSRHILGIHFRLPDEERVWIGYYYCEPRRVTAAEAVAMIRHASDPFGYEVIIPRSIRADEIHRVYAVNTVVGWRYFPNAHERRPCTCHTCMVGDFRGRKIKERAEAIFERNRRKRIAAGLLTQ